MGKKQGWFIFMLLAMEIKDKLKDGKSIDEICSEYNLSFKEVLDIVKKNKWGNVPNKTTTLLYISKSRGKYKLRKCNKNYGSYNSLEDAKKVRDYFMINGWDSEKLDDICDKLNVNRCVKGNKYIRERDGHFYLMGTEDGVHKLFGAYNSYEDARKVRDYCKTHGWVRKSIDEYCRVLGVERVKGSYELKWNKSLYH